jgi:uncharacterized protein (TIGR02284 family)
MNNDKIIDGLNSLLAKNYDSERGYKNAASKTENPTLQAFYKNKASQRYTFGHQIKNHILELGGSPDKGTSILGDMHNAWIDFKTALSFDKEESMLEAIETGEEACCRDYEDFLEMDNIPSNIRNTISHQKMQVKNALRKVEVFEEQFDS